MRAVLDVILLVIQLYVWIVIAGAILSWLLAFNIVNPRNQFVSMIGDAIFRLTEPVLSRIRRYMPNLGGLDISPIALILLLFLLQNIIIRYIYPNVF